MSKSDKATSSQDDPEAWLSKIYNSEDEINTLHAPQSQSFLSVIDFTDHLYRNKSGSSDKSTQSNNDLSEISINESDITVGRLRFSTQQSLPSEQSPDSEIGLLNTDNTLISALKRYSNVPGESTEQLYTIYEPTESYLDLLRKSTGPQYAILERKETYLGVPRTSMTPQYAISEPNEKYRNVASTSTAPQYMYEPNERYRSTFRASTAQQYAILERNKRYRSIVSGSIAPPYEISNRNKRYSVAGTSTEPQSEPNNCIGPFIRVKSNPFGSLKSINKNELTSSGKPVCKNMKPLVIENQCGLHYTPPCQFEEENEIKSSTTEEFGSALRRSTNVRMENLTFTGPPLPPCRATYETPKIIYEDENPEETCEEEPFDSSCERTTRCARAAKNLNSYGAPCGNQIRNQNNAPELLNAQRNRRETAKRLSYDESFYYHDEERDSCILQ